MAKIKIWEMRNKKNVSLRKLSQMTGISSTALNNYENQKRKITLYDLEIIAEALGCGINDLFDSKFKYKNK